MDAMIRSTGVVGLVTFVVLFTALIASTSASRRSWRVPRKRWRFISTQARAGQAHGGEWSGSDRLIRFVVGLCLLLGRAEGSPPWRSAVALVSGDPRERSCYSIPAGTPPRSVPRTSIWQWQLRLRCQSWVCQRLARSGRFCGMLWLGGAVHSRCRSLAWLVGDRQRVGARDRPVLLTSNPWLRWASPWIWMIIMCVQLVRSRVRC